MRVIVAFIVGWILAFPVYKKILMNSKVKEVLKLNINGILAILILILSTFEIIAGSYNPFLYFQF